eukprot:752138-Hanusia_phi.AAC.3
MRGHVGHHVLWHSPPRCTTPPIHYPPKKSILHGILNTPPLHQKEKEKAYSRATPCSPSSKSVMAGGRKREAGSGG